MCKSWVRKYRTKSTLYCFIASILIAVSNTVPFMFFKLDATLLTFKLSLVFVLSFLTLLFIVNLFKEFRDIKLSKPFVW